MFVPILRLYFSLFIACLLAVAVPSSSRAQAPKREFRAAWIATVANIDWPQKGGLSSEEQKASFIRLLDRMARMKMNAVIVQVRPAADAFYPSEKEPWSRYLTGKQGSPPNPYYDPLQFMIAEAHKRNMEFHAWFNPFRALMNSNSNPNPPDHVTRQHPDWLVRYGGKGYLNPGIPEARQYVQSVIMDVVNRYDIDAVHLDDYFYPYRIAGSEFGDAAAYRKYNPEHLSRDDWRRSNVDTFIQGLNKAIKSVKPFLKLGISPFGIWRNATKDPRGSNTRGGQTNYDDLYADVLLWMQQGWIDYLLPQLYWEHGHRAAPFEVLLPWWRDHDYGRQLYFGLGLYRMTGTPSLSWRSTQELLSQIQDIRSEAPGTGWSLYSLSSFDNISGPIEDSLRATDAHIALVPTMPWLDSLAPAAPHLSRTETGSGCFLQWSPGDVDARHYAVYRFDKNEPIHLQDAAHILAITREPQYLDASKQRDVVYVVTALDRLWNESKASNPVSR
ncbi:MAG: family 10 glycosylhydrolase [Bacteroidetes bacterium]|nr:family 10 glycosylhydrolase [Bacteroidota bacterium]